MLLFFGNNNIKKMSDNLSFLNCLYEKKIIYIDTDFISVDLIYLSNPPPPFKKNSTI